MRYRPIMLWMLLCSLIPAVAQGAINFGGPGVSISINLPVYPQLQRVPGYPVYYASGLSSNYFFYDGLYWVYEGDNWYASSWYNGPWRMVDPMDVPLYLLRVPVRYYRHAPAYFRGWRANDAPRWGDHWGQSWTRQRSGWDQWNRSSAPAPAPLPTYQRQFAGSKYPQAAQQAVIQSQNYRYQPNESVAQQHFQQQRVQAQSAPPPQAPATREQQTAKPQSRSPQVQQPQPAPAAREQPAAKPQPKPQQVQTQQTPGTREQQAAKPQSPRTERQPQQAPVAREQQAAKPQQVQPPRSAPVAREQPAAKPQAQRTDRQPPQAPAAREQQSAKPQPRPQQAQQPKPAPAAREQQAPNPQAQGKAPSGKEQNREKDNKEKGQDR